MTNGKKGLAKNVLSLGLIQVANYALPVLSVPIISRIIGPEKFGVINFTAAFVAYFTLLISYGFDFTATRKVASDPNNKNNCNIIFSEVFYTKIILFIVSVVVFSILLLSLTALRSEKIVAIFSFLFCFGAVFSVNWFFQAMQDLSKVAILDFIGKLLFTVVILVVIKKQSDYIWQPLIYSIVQICISMCSFLWAIKKYQIRIEKPKFRRCFELLNEEKIIFFSLIVVSVYTTTNTVILGLYQNSEQVGYFTAGQKLILIAQSILTIPLAQAFYPYIGKTFSENREKGLVIVQKMIPILVLSIGTVSILMLIFGPYILTLFYGPKFNPSIPVFQLLVFIPLISAINNVFGVQTMLNLKMDRLFLKITTCAAIFSLFLNLLLIKHLGCIGTAINWLLTELFILISMYILLKKKGINPIKLSYFRVSTFKTFLLPFKRKLMVRLPH